MSTPSGSTKFQKQTEDEIKRIALVGWQVRQALRQSLPAPPEQFFTVMVPGKVLNLNDYTGGLDASGNTTTALRPRDVQLAEAILCDDMPVLAGVQLGPTGKSVARSYAETLVKLAPSGTTVGVQDPDNTTLSNAEKRYQYAMKWLLSTDPDTGEKHIDSYVKKQKAYNDAYEKKVKDFDDALQKANSDPNNVTPADKRAAYDLFVAENNRSYRAMVQAAYMDWVVTGKKEEVEYWFAIVDNDTALSRVEASKESMRASTVSTPDGSTDYQTVQLTPSNWAWLALQKAQAGKTKTRTVEWYTWEIVRLQKLNLMLQALSTDFPKPAANPDTPAGTDTGSIPKDISDAAEKAIEKFVKAQVDYNNLAKTEPPDSTDDQKKKLQEAFDAMSTARNELNTSFAKFNQAVVSGLSNQINKSEDDAINEIVSKVADLTKKNTDLIATYTTARQRLLGGRVGDLQDNFATSVGIEPPAPDPEAAQPPPTTGGQPQPVNQADFWTSISVSVAESYDATQTSFTANSYSVGGGASWGLWSVGGSVNHSDQTSTVAKQMAHSSISVTFDCMRVDINRPWLRPELFYDSDLTVTQGDFISPGPMKLATLMDPDTYNGPGSELTPAARQVELARYSLFPLYPTAFLLAANIVLEIKGETSDIQSYFHTSTTSGSASVGWGPFSVSSSFSHTDTQTSSSCETTATGCRITVKSPQIVGWISQLLPAIPRINN